MTCSKCNAAMPMDAPGGLCPRCALMLGLATAGTLTNVGAPTTSGPLESSLTIGPYRTLRLLGAGGMGAVYLAEQTEPIRRQVALKIIKPGMGSEEIIRRFETERQALALMEHPNVAKVLDAGTTADGRPYFVMEYVPGIPITVYCDQKQLPAKDRLRLFGDVCRAIHHAHQKGVIHRDIKPSNVLVSERDGQPIVTVIDFGIAKAIDHRLAGETVFTQQGLLIGTPEYMSPEQASSSPDIDTTTDVYSLGVLLYELLTGVLPFDSQALRKEGLLEILRIIRETDPPRPVTRLRAMGDTAIGMAQRRDTTIGGLLKQVQGDLEWIIMCALEKDRARRYSSAAALAEDIERHLNDEPVRAGAPSRLYQLSKFVRRNRVLAISTAAVAAALVLGLVLTTVQYLRAERERAFAESNAREADRQRTLAESSAMRAEKEAVNARVAEGAAGKSRDLAEAEAEANRRTIYGAEMNRASQAWNEADIDLMRGFLDRHRPQPGKPDLRGFEWFHFWRLAYSRVAEFRPYSGPHVAFSPNSKTLWMTGGDAPVSTAFTWKRYRVGTLQAINTPVGRDVAVSPDGQRVVIAHYNDAAAVYDSATFLEVAKIPFSVVGAESDLSRSIMSYSPDGTVLAFIAGGPPGTNTFSLRGVVKLWDVKTGRERATLPDSQMTSSLAFSPDGRTLVTSHTAGPLRLWDVETARKIEDWPLNQNQTKRVMARFSPDGKWLAEASLGPTTVWDVTKRTAVYSQPLGRIFDLAFSPDSQLLALAGDNREVLVLEAPTGRRVGVVRGFGKSVNAVAFSPDGRFLAAGNYNPRVAVWDVDWILAQRVQSGFQNSAVAFSANGSVLLTGGFRDSTLRNGYTRAAVQSFPNGGDAAPAVNGVSLSSDGSVLSLANLSGLLRVIRRGTGDPIFLHRTTRRRSVLMDERLGPLGTFGAVSPSGEHVVTAHDSGAACVFHLRSKRQVAVLGKPGSNTYAAQYSPDGTLVAISGYQVINVGSPKPIVEMSLWDTRTWKRRFDLVRPGKDEWYSQFVAFSPDGLRLATFDSNNDVVLWDTRTGQRTQTLEGAKGSARCLAFSPDNRRVIVCDNRDIYFWDLVNGQAVNIRHPFRINGAAFAPDGKTLAVVDSAGRTLYLDATPPAALPRLISK